MKLREIFFNRKDLENTKLHYLECTRIKPDEKAPNFILDAVFEQKDFEKSEKFFNIVLSLDLKIKCQIIIWV